MVLLGVSRSGTTMLREMLNQHPEIAIPTESYFIPQLWTRHRESPDPDRFANDLGRLARVREWGVTPAEVRERLSAKPSFAEAIQAPYRAYAAARGKRRYGDKTPAYMQHLDVLERAFPGAQYVHLVRDGRDAGLSFVEMRRRPRFNWARPRGLGTFAAQWRREVEAARRSVGVGPPAAISSCATRTWWRSRRPSCASYASSSGSASTPRCSSTT